MHSITTTETISIGSSPSVSASPLHTVWNKDFLQTAFKAAPDQGALVKALDMLNQRLEAMEQRMFPKLN